MMDYLWFYTKWGVIGFIIGWPIGYFVGSFL